MMRATFPPDATVDPAPRGAAPVGRMSELSAMELAAVVFHRAWCDGGDARSLIARDFARVLAPEDTFRAIEDFDALMRTMLSAQRRTIMRHGLDCPCFCGDESAFAQMIVSAAMRDRDDAMLFAATLVTGPAAFRLVALAEDLGQVFLRLGRLGPAGRLDVAPGATRH